MSVRSIRVFSLAHSAAAVRRSPTKTVKVYTDLPTVHVQQDGTPTRPLPDWRRGADPPKIIQASPELNVFSDQPSVHKPKRGRNHGKGTKDDHTEQDTPSQRAAAGEDTDPDSVAPQKRQKAALTTKGKLLKAKDVSGPPQNLLARGILENLEKFPHCLLLTRVGQFYESYFNQAIEISRLLNIKLTTRKWDGSRIPMCGFPLIHIDKHLKVLVQQKKRFVAMCEEFPRLSNQGSKVFDRRVVRVITPGTLIDEPFLNPYENNYLLSLSIPDSDTTGLLGLAWIDVSTGEFFSKTTAVDSLRDELVRIAPREVVLDKSLESMTSHPVFQILAEENSLVSFVSAADETGASPSHKHFTTTMKYSVPSRVSHADPAQGSLHNQETVAVDLLTTYLRANLLEHMPPLTSPSREVLEARMQIDSHTIRALEIREEIGGHTKGSLLSAIKRTITSGGTRLLTRWLCSPSTSVSEINARQSLVALFCDRPHFRADIMGALMDVEDTGRIVQKLTLGRGDTNDFLAIKRTALLWTKIMKRIEEERQLEAAERRNFDPADWNSIDALMSRMVDLEDLSTKIASAVEDASPINEGLADEPLEPEADESSNIGPSDSESNIFWRYGKRTIKPGFSSKLTTLHSFLKILFDKREKMECDLQLAYDAPSLTLRASPAQGMHVHLTRARRDQTKLNAAPEFVTIAESGSTRCYFFKEWSQLGGQIADTTVALNAAEKEAFNVLRDEVIRRSSFLRRNARILDELDVALAFASLAKEMNFVRPVLLDDPTYSVKNGRHPSVELGLLRVGRVFTPNSLELSPTSRLHVITGPNMAGKSTFLRQTALIAILAQIGSFVPADQAAIGIVDKLFSRIGAKDDLFHDRSTFMVEMLETAEILRRATPKSLVIMDEVGRGTTVVDGLAIAYATIHHLVSRNQCRSLFSTHFHELSDMIGYPHSKPDRSIFNSIDFFCTDVVETDDGHFTYRYRVCPGVNRNSHGLKVAQLAGMPPEAMDIAKNTLSLLKARRSDH